MIYSTAQLSEGGKLGWELQLQILSCSAYADDVLLRAHNDDVILGEAFD